MKAHRDTSSDTTPFDIINTAQHVVLPDGSSPVAMGSGVVSGVLGEGGVAIVYEIYNNRLGVKRAVKVLKPNSSRQSRGRFETEMRITAQLHHPNVVEIHSVGDWNGLPYIEMELIRGISLDKIIKERGALPFPMVLAIGIMVCKALEFTHSHVYQMEGKEYKGILHRDLKPANIMVGTGGIVKLMDFGIARPTDISLHTMEGDFVGSLQYVSPEQLHGKPVDARADIFSLGCVLYEMVTGVKAFPEVNVALLATSRLKNHYRALRDLKTKIPRSFTKMVQNCLAFDREDRVEAVTHVRILLEKLFSQITAVRPEEAVEYFTSNTAQHRVLKFKRRTSPVVFAVAGGVAALAVTTAVVTALVWMPDAEPPAAVQQPAAKQTDTVVVTKTDTVRLAAPEKQSLAAGKATAKKILKHTSAELKPAVTAAPPGLLEQLRASYQTDNISAILTGELMKGSHQKVLTLLSELPAGDPPAAQRTVLRARALDGLGRTAALRVLLQQSADATDCETCLMKVRFAWQDSRYADGLALLKTCAAAPAALMPKDSADRMASYYAAQCRTGIFSQDSTAASRQAALDSWFSVKYALRTMKGHPYFVEANRQIRLLTP